MNITGRRKIALTLNMASMMDVVFLLLIFFMLSSSFMKADNSGIKVDLPDASSSEVNDKQDITISIKSDNTIYLNGKHISSNYLEESINEIISRSGSVNVTVRADQKSELMHTVFILDAAKRAGAGNVFISTVNKDER
ncbi:MAG TPA: biopolymer transporter ExbD [Spirochaetota bacterium]|nr:biopolymer transporter ExbD [Spirochaetota bacterium]HPJ35772.1 biopolymer transporter ExbD [Spirochaetota bacterium]